MESSPSPLGKVPQGEAAGADEAGVQYEFAETPQKTQRSTAPHPAPPGPPSPKGNVVNLSVGNAVLGVPAGAVRKHRTRKSYRTAAFGGRNAEDGVPYKQNLNIRKAAMSGA